MPAEKKAKNKPATKQAAATRKPPTSLERRSAQDPYTGPSSKRIERSFSKGKIITLENFRGLIDWS